MDDVENVGFSALGIGALWDLGAFFDGVKNFP